MRVFSAFSKQIKLLAPGLLVCYVLASCQQEDPAFDKELEFCMGGSDCHGIYSRTELTDPSGLKCVKQGNTCRTTVASSARTQEEFSIFKTYYDRNDLAGYFTHISEYDDLFPGLRYQNDIKDKIINGTYKVIVLPDNSIVVYKNNQLTEENVVLGYKPV
ncbi:MAG: hypothetical protein ABL876_09390 [Chitinophagaceae bacterium]